MTDKSNWKLVPVEPTEEMVRAGGEVDVVALVDKSLAADIFRAMLDAAPASPSPPLSVAFDPLNGGCPHCKWLDTNLGRVLDKKCDLHQRIEEMQADRALDRSIIKGQGDLIRRVCEVIGAGEDDDPVERAKERMEEIAELEAALTPAPTPVAAGGEADAYLRALLDYSSGFYGAAIEHGMKPGPAADAVQHIERAARNLHRLALAKPASEPADGAVRGAAQPFIDQLIAFESSFDDDHTRSFERVGDTTTVKIEVKYGDLLTLRAALSAPASSSPAKPAPAVEAVREGFVTITTNGTTRTIPADEPVFLIRGQDVIGGAAVRAWATLAEASGADFDMCQVAREHASKMDAWPKKKIADLPEQEDGQ